MNKRTALVVCLFPFAVGGQFASAAEPTDSGAAPAVDTSGWKCRFCPEETGFNGEVEFGLGYLSDDSFKFGEYTGLTDKGSYFIGNADVRYRNEEGYYSEIVARDLGLDSRLVGVESGVQGRYKFSFGYHELSHFISDSARTPYRGTGGDNLTLPPGWTTAGTTGTMPDLATSLRNVELETQRKILEVGAAFLSGERWQYGMNVRHQTQEGQRRSSGTFFFSAAQLVKPIDYVTDEIDVFATYTSNRLQARLAYYGSLFDNRNESLTWQNPYTPIVPGADAGQLALAPDNDFHQILGAIGYQFTKATRGTAELAVGRMRQNEDFLSATLNPNIMAPTLPRSSLDGEVDTVNAKMQLISDVTDKLRLNAAYSYNDRDNKTPQDSYSRVTTDSFVAPARTNTPYSFTRNTLKLSGDYRMARQTRGSLGYDYDIFERTNLEVEETKEGTIWAKIIARASNNMDLLFNIARADRNGSSYDPVPETSPPQNPLMRKYNMADRERDTAGVYVSITPSNVVSFTVGADFAKADYNESEIGLTESRETSLSADLSWVVTKKATVHVFGTQQIIKSWQAGSESLSTPDWFARNDDTINTLGLGLKYAVIERRLDVGADYTVSKSRGEIAMDTPAPAPPLPNLRTSLQSIKLYADYRMADHWSLHAAWWYESYDSSDWAIDGVNPDTIPNVLTLGEMEPNYNQNFVVLSARYRF